MIMMMCFVIIYAPSKKSKEWACIGMLSKIFIQSYLIDDLICIMNALDSAY